MSTRREFVEGAAGIAFVACNMTGIAPVQAQGRRREVVVNGRRVKTIDVHAHCAVPEAMALMGRKVEPQALLMSNAADRIRAMDEQDYILGTPGLSDDERVAMLGGTAAKLLGIKT